MKTQVDKFSEYKMIADHLPFGVTAQDLKGRLIYANAAAAKIMGFTTTTALLSAGASEILSKFVIYDEHGNLFPYENLPGRLVLKNKKQEEAIMRFKKNHTKKEYWSRVVSTPLLKKSGEVKVVLNIFYDYTSYQKEKEAYVLLKEHENTLRLALETGNMGIWDWDIQSDVFTWSDGLQPSYGLRKGNRQGTLRDFLQHIHPQDRKRTRRSIMNTLKTLKPYEQEFRIRWPNGKNHWMYKKGEVLLDNNAKPSRMIGVGMNITKRKMAEEALIQSEQKLKSMFNASLDAMVVVDSHMHIHDANIAAVKLFSTSRGSLLNVSLLSLVRHEDKKNFTAIWKKFMKTGFVRNEMTITDKNGTVLTLDYSGKAGFLPHTHLLVFRDITGRIKEEERREHLLGLASHELRTPLASIKAFIEILKRTLKEQHNEKIDHYLAKIDDKTDIVTRLINDLLDVARIRDNRFEFYYEHFEFDPFFDDLLKDIQVTVTTHTFVKSGNTGISITADKYRLSQVITNIVKNAIRYSPNANRIIISVERKNRRILISVQDFGIGIARKDLKKIFHLFYKADIENRKQVFGIGAGLYIAKNIVESHGGTIWAESIPSKGSTFYISLPINSKPNKSMRLSKKLI